jgi:hypothetical protein
MSGAAHSILPSNSLADLQDTDLLMVHAWNGQSRSSIVDSLVELRHS